MTKTDDWRGEHLISANIPDRSVKQRPKVKPGTRSGRVMAYLTSLPIHKTATTTEIAAAIREDRDDVSSSLAYLHRSGMVEAKKEPGQYRFGKLVRGAAHQWRVAK